MGTDGLAVSAGNLLARVAPAGLHRFAPMAYLRDLLRILPRWPLDRCLELGLKCWAKTRARLDSRDLAGDRTPHRPGAGRAA